MSSPIVFAVDGNWYLHRCFYTMKPQANKSKFDAIMSYRMAGMVCKDALSVGATHIVVAFDGPKGFRYKVWPQYKANRKGGASAPEKDVEKPEVRDVYESLPAVQKYFKRAGIPFVQLPTFEGDDVLATIAHQADIQGYKAVLGCSDKDAYQNLSKIVSMWTENSGYLTWKDAEKKKGVRISQMIEYQMLLGDANDNIHGLHKYGPVTVARILNEHGSIKGWYDDCRKKLKSVPGGTKLTAATLKAHKKLVAKAEKEKKLLVTHQDHLKRNRKLVTLVKDCFEFDFKKDFALRGSAMDGLPGYYYDLQSAMSSKPKTKKGLLGMKRLGQSM